MINGVLLVSDHVHGTLDTDSVVNPAGGANYGSGGAYDTYVIQAGDTLTRLAHRFGTTIKSLQTLNQIKNAHHIQAGDQLLVPSSSTKVTTQASTKVKKGCVTHRTDGAAVVTSVHVCGFEKVSREDFVRMALTSMGINLRGTGGGTPRVAVFQ